MALIDTLARPRAAIGVIDDLPVPRTRGGFQTQLFERYQRRMAEVDTLLRDMFAGGVSNEDSCLLLFYAVVRTLLYQLSSLE